MTKPKAPGTLLPRGEARPGSAGQRSFRGKTAQLITPVRPEALAKLKAIAARQAISISDALELVVERAVSESGFVTPAMMPAGRVRRRFLCPRCAPTENTRRNPERGSARKWLVLLWLLWSRQSDLN